MAFPVKTIYLLFWFRMIW